MKYTPFSPSTSGACPVSMPSSRHWRSSAGPNGSLPTRVMKPTRPSSRAAAASAFSTSPAEAARQLPRVAPAAGRRAAPPCIRPRQSDRSGAGSSRHPSAIDHQRVAVHVVRRRRSKEYRRTAQVLGTSPAARRNAFHDLAAAMFVLPQRSRIGRFDIARRNAVNVNIFGRKLVCKKLLSIPPRHVCWPCTTARGCRPGS